MPSRLVASAIGAFLAGAAILLLAEAELLRVLGALGLLAAIVCGTFAIADPRELGRDEEDQGS